MNTFSMNPPVTLTGIALERRARTHIDMVTVTIDNTAYIVDIKLPDARNNLCQVGFNVTLDGHVDISGMVDTGALARDVPMSYRHNMQRHRPPAPWSISFDLPGPVDSRFPPPKLYANGYMEIVVLKRRQGAIHAALP